MIVESLVQRSTEVVLREHVADLQAIEFLIKAKLAELYPRGHHFQFNLMHGQKNPSRGSVVGWPGGEYCTVRFALEPKNPKGRGTPHGRPFVNVPMENIVGPI